MSRKLVVEIVGDVSSLNKTFAQAEKSTKRFGHEMETTGKRVSAGALSGGALRGLGKAASFVAGGAAFGGLAVAMKGAFAEMQSAQQVMAQTNAVLKSTGGIANVTAKHVDALADSMLKKTGIDDEAIKTSENMLLTFTKLRNEAGKGNKVFDQATQAAADMATSMNRGAIPSAEQLQTASLRLGKALNDPIKGVGALSRVGVQFTKQQKDQIKQLVETGHTMDAQKIILGELKTEFGGAADAAGKTLAGRLSVLKETVSNLGGEIAKQLAPQIEHVLGVALKWLQNSKNQKTVLDTVKAVAHALGEVLKTLVGVFRALNKITGSTKHTVELLAGAFVAFKALKLAGTFAGIARNIGLIGSRASGAKAGVGALRGSLVGKAGLAGAALAAGFEIGNLLLKIGPIRKAMESLGGKVQDVAAKLGLSPSEGPAPLAVGAGSFLRDRARRLEAGGLSVEQTAVRLAATHPRIPRHDIDVFAGVTGSRPTIGAGVPAPIELHSTVVLDGQAVARSVSRHQARAGQRTSRQTSGQRG